MTFPPEVASETTNDWGIPGYDIRDSAFGVEISRKGGRPLVIDYAVVGKVADNLLECSINSKGMETLQVDAEDIQKDDWFLGLNMTVIWSHPTISDGKKLIRIGLRSDTGALANIGLPVKHQVVVRRKIYQNDDDKPEPYLSDGFHFEGEDQ